MHSITLDSQLLREVNLSVKRALPIVVLILIGSILGLFVWARAPLGPLSQEEISRPRIYAYRDWQSVGVRVESGARIYLRAQGEWLYTPGEYHGPEGHREYRAPDTYPIPAVPGGVLLGRVGESGRPFLVGRGGTFYADQSGLLYLRINDDILSDNEGYVAVELEVTEAEAPD